MVSLIASAGLAIVAYGWWVWFGVWRERREEAKKWGKEGNVGGGEEAGWAMENNGQANTNVGFEHGVAREVN